MRIGGSVVAPDISDVESFINVCRDCGFTAVQFPFDFKTPVSKIDEYVKALKEADITIAEVGAWNNNPLHPDKNVREQSVSNIIKQLELSEYIGAVCCVNVVGSESDVWDGPHPDSFSKRVFDKVVETTVRIVDAVNPKKTAFSYETMPWMIPHSPDCNLELVNAVNRSGFGVHLDIINMINSPERYYSNADFTRECFKKLSAHILSIHVKDIVMVSQLTVHLSECMLGEGGYDLNAFLAEAVKLDKDMPVLTEHMKYQDEFKTAVAYLRAFAAKNNYEVF